MSIYTKRGDRGITDMAHTSNISKSDDRIRLLGTIDELNSHIDLVRSMLSQAEVISLLENIQNNLNLIAAGVSNPYDRNSRISEKETAFLETETDRMEALCAQPVPEKLTGKNRLAAEIEITRAVARRAERCLAQVSVKFGAALFYLRSYDIKNNRTIFQYGFLVRNLFTLKFVLNVFFRIIQFQFFHKNIPHLIARTFIKNFPY